MKATNCTIALLTGVLTSLGAAHAQDAGEKVVALATQYLSTPYVAHTLEQDGPEELVLNTDEVDCTTFVEYVLAEALCTPNDKGEVSEAEFADNLQRIRYRDGRIDGYASRLHYFADWADNAVKAGILTDVCASQHTPVQTLSLSYMTANPDQYPILTEDLGQAARIREAEQALTGKQVHYLPKTELPYNGTPWIKNGDLIAVTTNIKGLDVKHLGIAFYVEGKLTLIHASQAEGKVVVGRKSLSFVLEDDPKATGIRVLRLNR